MHPRYSDPHDWRSGAPWPSGPRQDMPLRPTHERGRPAHDFAGPPPRYDGADPRLAGSDAMFHAWDRPRMQDGGCLQHGGRIPPAFGAFPNRFDLPPPDKYGLYPPTHYEESWDVQHVRGMDHRPPVRETDNLASARPTNILDAKDASSRVHETKRVTNDALPLHTLCTVDRYRGDILVRYPRLHVPRDFVCMTANWNLLLLVPGRQMEVDMEAIGNPGTRPEIVLDVNGARLPSRAPILKANSTPGTQLAVASLAEIPTKFSVRVVLCRHTEVESPHMLLVNRGEDTGLIGGSWNSQADGGDPSIDDAALTACAVRVFREQTGADLTPCKVWRKLVQVSFHRPSEREGEKEYPEELELVTVLECVDWHTAAILYSANPGGGTWHATFDAHTVERASVPSARLAPPPLQPCLVLSTMASGQPPAVSLVMQNIFSLRKEPAKSSKERTFESHLVAEALWERYQRVYALAILHTIVAAAKIHTAAVGDKRPPSGRLGIKLSKALITRAFHWYDPGNTGTVGKHDLEDIFLFACANVSKTQVDHAVDNAVEHFGSKSRRDVVYARLLAFIES